MPQLNRLHFHLIRLFKQRFLAYDCMKRKNRLGQKSKMLAIKIVIRLLDSGKCLQLKIMVEFADLCHLNVIAVFLKNLQLFKLHLYFV